MDRGCAEAKGEVGRAQEAVRSWTGGVSADHVGDGGLGARDGAARRQPAPGSAVKKRARGSPRSSLTAFKTGRGLACH